MAEQKGADGSSTTSDGKGTPNGLLVDKLVFADGENMWQTLLQRVTSQASQGDKVLLVLGDKDSGAAELIAKFADSSAKAGGGLAGTTRPYNRGSLLTSPSRSRGGLLGPATLKKSELTTPAASGGKSGSSGSPHENLMRFHYRAVRSTEDADRGDVISRLDIIEVFNRDVRANLPLLLDEILPASLEDLMVAITVDLSQPRSVGSSIAFWSEFATEFARALETRWGEDERRNAKDKISSHMQFYVDPALAQEQQISEAERAAIAVDRSVPEINFGFPVFVVGTRADLLVKSLGSLEAPKSMEALSHQLRRFCLPYGASLLFTLSGDNPNFTSGTGLTSLSSTTTRASVASQASQDSRARASTATSQASTAGSTATTGTVASQQWIPSAVTTAQLFHDYVVHRLYGLEFSQQPRAFGGSVDEYEMAAIFIPSGYDTENLIKATEVSGSSDGMDTNGDAPTETKRPVQHLAVLDRLFPAGTGRTNNPISAEPKAEEKVSLPPPAAFLEHLRVEIERSGFVRSSSSSRTRKGEAGESSQRRNNLTAAAAGGATKDSTRRVSTSARDSDRLARAAAAAAGGSRKGTTSGASVGRSSRTASGASGRPGKDNAAVKNFFQSLLSNSGSNRSSAPASSRSKDTRREARKALERGQK